ncbi:hypothetical protein R9X47_14495 [Wukongibacter baidiensis]|uniref:hypothetical protein n=1 Tax=Wukongibacter baidiensis TaxID=1723361 RepID=UPI003D7F7125
MLNIKEAGRYANFLQKNIDLLKNFFINDTLIYNTREEHLKSKVLKNESDEIKLIEEKSDLDISLEDALYLIDSLINKKMELSMAINSAKAKTLVDWTENGEQLPLDTAIEYNKNLRGFAMSPLEDLTLNRSEEYIKDGIGYLINNEGNQSQYRYEIKVIKKINYDRNIVKNLYKKTLNKADLLSEAIDKAMLKKSIAFEMEYNIHDSLEDLVEKFKKHKSNKKD